MEDPDAGAAGPGPVRGSLIERFGLAAEPADQGDGADGAEGAEAVPGAEELFWFRWITGHQVSFILWRLIGQLVHDASSHPAGSRSQDEVDSMLVSVRNYVRGYCAMLLYTATCPRGLYEDMIRPSMRLRHPSFSGSWAPDYWPIKDLLRGRRTALTETVEARELVEAIRVQRLVHEVIAARLVPDGQSLLRRSAFRSGDLRVLQLLYDNYFLTLRGAVTQHDVTAQLQRRLVAIVRDCAVNGLHPEGHGAPDRIGEPWFAEVAACEDGIIGILDEVAGSDVRMPSAVTGARPVGLG
ncbi:L-tyrosine 3-hydroxylase [Actinomadura decatromicini]|uniref:L-tyrosine 3-hydroxylase n=1 Tax=Actinomadura decatromicini TaxID=2604572 RepID=A0A5D3FW02_9ACTN|nr:L-tyrosine 3-hydroxylase [Actinomadura decatromicini]TYK52413.1 L-tyrosine 3-hydroxylase [Actinomadura decatromicini]